MRLSEQISHGGLTLNVVGISAWGESESCNHGYKDCFLCPCLSDKCLFAVTYACVLALVRYKHFAKKVLPPYLNNSSAVTSDWMLL